jgi:hypothetical protein
MLDSTIKTIYALKQNYREMAINGGDAIVKPLWAEITGTPVEGFNDLTMTNLAKEIFLDFLKSSDDHNYEIQSLFTGFPTASPIEFRAAIWNTLALASVKDKNGNYINGFRELTD